MTHAALPLPIGVRRATTVAPSTKSVGADWRARLARKLWFSDLVILLVVVFGAQVAWFGGLDAVVATVEPGSPARVPYWLFGLGLVGVWMWALSLADTRQPGVVGYGNLEYMRMLSASVRIFTAVAILAFVFQMSFARGYLLIALPAATVTLLASRWLWRQQLIRWRRDGLYVARTLIVGSAPSVAALAREVQRHPRLGYRLMGVCVPETGGLPELEGLPVVGGLDDIEQVVSALDADTIIVTSSDELSPARVKRLSWRLGEDRRDLVFAPSILDVTGPRVHARPVAGLPLIHVETPRLTLGQQVAKRIFDIVGAVVLLAVLSPIFFMVTVLVRATSAGPALFVQTRIGRAGRPFQMVKFRSMVHGAHTMRPALGPGDIGNEVLFKLSTDPRVTPFGCWLRRHSLDELPQLLNVVSGSMSLVGPRPHLPEEVEQYADDVHRRFIMKPGMTGAWQVGGRSALSWEDSVRLDLSYVDNWSLANDLVILLKTIRAVLSPGRTAA